MGTGHASSLKDYRSVRTDGVIPKQEQGPRNRERQGGQLPEDDERSRQQALLPGQR